MLKPTLACLLFFLFRSFLAAQSSLPDSERGSSEAYVYTMDQKNLRKIYWKKVPLTEDLLGTEVTKYKRGKAVPPLERGNYMIVEADGNRLKFTGYAVDDLSYQIVPNEQFMLCLYDSTGKRVEDAVVTCGSKKLHFDRTTGTYRTSAAMTDRIIEIDHRGVFHYLEIEDEYGYETPFPWRKRIKSRIRRNWYGWRRRVVRLFRPAERDRNRDRKEAYDGFIVFSKPRYKPGETVRLKAYLTRKNGVPYDKPASIRLKGGWHPRLDTLLTVCEPYRSGLYEYAFRLSDSLALTLDKDYWVVLEPANSDGIRESFHYEDYELDNLRFDLRADQDEYIAGDSVRIHLKATDENGMAVYGGKARLWVRADRINGQNKNEVVFVPDTLWRTEVDMQAVSEKTVVLPDSVFPAGVSLRCRVQASYLGPDNERQTGSTTFDRDLQEYGIRFSFTGGKLSIEQVYKGRSQQVAAEVRIEDENDRLIAVDSVRLPASIRIPWYASGVDVTTARATDYCFLDEIDPELNYTFSRYADSIRLQVDNPAEIPFWYTVRRNKKDIASGYATRLDYSTADAGGGYSMHLSYLFGGTGRFFTRELPEVRKNLSLDVATPVTVYPGQRAKVIVSVTDKKGKPVAGSDVTAYSFTSRFGDRILWQPNIGRIPAKVRAAKPFRIRQYEPEDIASAGREADMNWKAWKDVLSLDTVEYYKFLYPDPCYAYAEPSADGSTLLMPYVVIDGALQGIHLLWIDDRLYYTDLAQQAGAYVFQVEPGKHNLRIRTYDREIRVFNLWVEAGAKNIFSFDADRFYSKTTYKKDGEQSFLVVSAQPVEKSGRGMLRKTEREELAAQLITLDNRFGKMEFPGIGSSVDLPVYLQAGPTLYPLNFSIKPLYYPQSGFAQPFSLLGPFPVCNYRSGLPGFASVYEGNTLLAYLDLEGGNRYTVYDNYQKIRSWKTLPFSWELMRHTPAADFKANPLTHRQIESNFEKTLNGYLATWKGEINWTPVKRTPGSARLQLSLRRDTAGRELRPVLIAACSEGPGRTIYRLYYGGTREFDNLPSGNVRLNLVFSDSTVYSRTFVLQPDGKNYLELDSTGYESGNPAARDAFQVFRRRIKKIPVQNPYLVVSRAETDSVVFRQNDADASRSGLAKKGWITGVVTDESGEPVIGASVWLAGLQVAATDLNGEFELEASAGGKLEVGSIGYLSKELNGRPGRRYVVVLEESCQMMDEVVVAGYSAPPSSVTVGASMSIGAGPDDGTDFLIRGISTLTQKEKEPPLILVNGLPFEGNPNEIDPGSITDIRIWKGAQAIAIYGPRGANGVLLIQTDGLILRKKDGENPGEESDLSDDRAAATIFEAAEDGNRLRRNFRDDAFWQPRLTTDDRGQASFEVTYPDDITGWHAYFIAIDGKKRMDAGQLTVRSFKGLTARLSMPRFAVRGDRASAVGRIVNHWGDSATVVRRIGTDRQRVQDSLRIALSHVDYIPVETGSADSVTVTYTLEQAGGYFDGEERRIPVLDRGLLQTSGDFRVISDSGVHTFASDPSLGPVTVHAEASCIDEFLREIERVEAYPYLCNEQTASKIKVLLLKKRFYKEQGLPCKDDRKIRSLIERLIKNSNAEGQWGWWNREQTDPWVTRQVISALLDAEEAGFQTRFDRYETEKLFQQEISEFLEILRTGTAHVSSFAKEILLDRLVFLCRIGSPAPCGDYLNEIDKYLESRSLRDKLRTLYVRTLTDSGKKIDTDSLLSWSKQTLLGSLYWEEPENGGEAAPRFPVPSGGCVENTLLAYRILKHAGGFDRELEKIRNYFFEIRRTGHWQNTYESAQILQTVWPDLVKGGDPSGKVRMEFGGKHITEFPYTEQVPPGTPLTVRKSGAFPLFVTAYQQAWNPQPEPEKEKGFEVGSVFVSNRDTVSFLRAGETAVLETTVRLKGAAEYVQIEVPVPAGCSYETKDTDYFRGEIHREYFKEKVVIFCRRLPAGEHTFAVRLLPRFSGTYHLNPAKAELMYFPSFYGNNALKTVDIVR